jgi:hypothetical protein
VYMPSHLDALFSYVTAFGDINEVPADQVIQSVCTCGETKFWMQCSEEDGVAMRTCSACKLQAYIGDSDEQWADADTGDAMCPCGTKLFEIGVGYCLTDSGEVSWMIVGARCVACADIGIYADWSINFEPSKFLLQKS